MARIRIVAACGTFLLVVATAFSSASAQTAAGSAAGQPLPLLQFLQHKSKAKLPPRPKLGAKAATKRTVKISELWIAKHAFARRRKVIAEARPAAAPVTAAANPTPTLMPDQPPLSVITAPVVDTSPNQIVTGSHSVQAALPNGLNQTDAGPRPNDSVRTAVADPAAPPVAHAMVVNAEASGAAGPMGSASWLAHVLAALGGAITAGAVAWFLIRPASERIYG